jgi:hypothetical protein
MIEFLILLLHVLISSFKTQVRLEAEIVLLRHQLSVLRQRVPSKPRLTVADRLLLVWLYRSEIKMVPMVMPLPGVLQPWVYVITQRLLGHLGRTGMRRG